jgi:hypothetical protein
VDGSTNDTKKQKPMPELVLPPSCAAPPSMRYVMYEGIGVRGPIEERKVIGLSLHFKHCSSSTTVVGVFISLGKQKSLQQHESSQGLRQEYNFVKINQDGSMQFSDDVLTVDFDASSPTTYWEQLDSTHRDVMCRTAMATTDLLYPLLKSSSGGRVTIANAKDPMNSVEIHGYLKAKIMVIVQETQDKVFLVTLFGSKPQSLCIRNKQAPGLVPLSQIPWNLQLVSDFSFRRHDFEVGLFDKYSEAAFYAAVKNFMNASERLDQDSCRSHSCRSSCEDCDDQEAIVGLKRHERTSNFLCWVLRFFNSTLQDGQKEYIQDINFYTIYSRVAWLRWEAQFLRMQNGGRDTSIKIGFHGIKSKDSFEVAQSISKNGFDMAYFLTQGLNQYGQGIYLATKARYCCDGYIESPGENNGKNHILVCAFMPGNCKSGGTPKQPMAPGQDSWRASTADGDIYAVCEALPLVLIEF